MATVAREQVIELIDDLPSESLAELVRFIEFLRFRSGHEKSARAAEAEAPLRAIALRRLPPEDERRLSFLRARKDEGRLLPEEHAELLAYVDRIEREDAERAQALFDLARLRNVPIRTLMTSLGLAPSSDA